MGSKGREIVGANLDEILDRLNKAFVDEWLAYHQYWMGAKLVKGPMKDAVMAELIQHAADELRHAELVTGRIIQLGGKPVTTPAKWMENGDCGYLEPVDEFVATLLEQNVRGEQCAIAFYNDLLKLTRDADPVTYNMALQILQDEVEHEEDLQALVEDLEGLLKPA